MSESTARVIRTPDQRLRVFVSSTLQEVADERQAAREAIEHLRLAPVLFELGARPHPPERSVPRLPRSKPHLRRHLLAEVRLGRARHDMCLVWKMNTTYRTTSRIDLHQSPCA